MSDFTKPALNSTYTNFITELKFRDEVVGSLYSSDVAVTGLPADNSTDWGVRSIRWNATNKYFQRRNSANNGWERLEGASGTHKFVNLEAGNITATSALSGSSISTSGQVQGARVNVTGSTKPANGLYLPTTNEIRFTTNSTDRLTIEASGEVGINTVNPAHTLDVNGSFRVSNGSSDSRFELGSGGTGNRSAYIDFVGDTTYDDYGLRIIRTSSGANTASEIIHRGTGQFILEANEAADMLFKTSNTTRMVIDSGGSVCIGNDTSPDDHLHVRQATNNAVFMRVSNNEGYARFGTDANHMMLDNDVINLRNRAGSTTYLISSSSLFDIKTAAKASSLSITNNIQPSSGNTDTKGINFAQNIGGGTGDKAYIRYYSESGDNTRLKIGIENDADDDIYLSGSLVHTSSNFSVNGTCTATSFTGNGANLTAVNATSVDGIDSGSFLRSDANDTCSGVISFTSQTGKGKIGVGTTPASTFNSALSAAIALGDNDTGIGQRSDGQLELWANNNEIINISTSEIRCYRNLIPDPTNNRNLGSSSNRWNNLFINDLNLSNKGSQNDVDGTWGDYTIQEGEESLFIKNNRNGKIYKMNWTEVEM